MAKASTSVAWFYCWDICTWSITVVGSTRLSLFSILWSGSCRENLNVGHLVCDEVAACPLSGWEEFLHLLPVGTFLSLLTEETAELCREMSLVAGAWKSILWSVGRSMPSFFSAEHLPCFIARWTSALSSSDLLPCTGACPHSDTHLCSEKQTP